MARRTLFITYIAAYLLAVGAIVRYLVSFRDDRFWAGLLASVAIFMMFYYA